MRDLSLEHFMDVQRKRVRQQCTACDKRLEARRRERLSVTLQGMDNAEQISSICHVSGRHVSGRRRPGMDGQT